MKNLGKFYLDADIVERNFVAARKILSHFVVVRCELLYHRKEFEYIAISDLFEPYLPYTEIPTYVVQVEDEEGNITVYKETQR